ncbi:MULTISPECIES: TrbI/VirB10 family protein [Acidiphilium]|uniref:Intracellular multiplication protein IcmE n=1 Tax=Acidiphilium rubrum TaxID=526 RepID=A0A8G2FF63_ACIRU|nr:MULTISPECIES: TrbI/VirB10 family protein [Acidiphilium]SIR29661.1 intracellular multiplication protein IcmE [Acidiphilium rubrum]
MAARFPILDQLRTGVSSVGKRKLLIGAGVLGVTAISAYAVVKPKPKPPTSVVGFVPKLGHGGGTRNNSRSAYDQQLMKDQDALKAKKAGAHGGSYAGPFGNAVADRPRQMPQRAVAAIVPVAQTFTPQPGATHPSTQPSTQPTHPFAAMTRRHTDPTPKSVASYDPSRYQAYTAQIRSLMGQMNGPEPATNVIIKPVVAKDPPPMPVSASRTDPAEASGKIPFGVPRDRPKVLIPAGHGVYGVTKLGVSSDQGASPVEVQALSGPIAGDDMLGSFSREGDRLVIKLTSITLKDGEQASINALVVTPDTMRTAVATSVNEHYVDRIILPAAAAFVEALGGSLGQSGSVEQTSPLGGLTVFTHVNTAQAVAAGFGNAAGTLGNIIQQTAPKGPTVKLAAGTDVGVLFLSPLKASTP